jgi:hypothetical protein
MSASYDLKVTVPGPDVPDAGDGPSFRRILVPVGSSAESAWQADMIVLTRRRRPALSRIVLGSVADQVMRKASCPVLTVHPNRK